MKVLQATIFLLFLSSFALGHECIHNKVQQKIEYATDLFDADAKAAFKESSHRNLQSYQSIRIYADYGGLSSANAQMHEYITNHLMPTAISYFEKTLKVYRATQPLRFTQSCGTSPSSTVRNGVEADLVILVTAEYSSESYLAYAAACSVSTINNRPIYGLVNFNLRLLPIETELQWRENYLTTIHEIAHILGFSSNLYQYFVEPGTDQEIDVAFEKTLPNGLKVNYLDVYPLTDRLREHFGCPDLEGGYLENQGSAGSAGSHWERQTFFNEFMTASDITDVKISEFTLALFEGTGWYQVDYSNADSFVWGKGKGCEFVDDPCISNGVPSATPEFCPTLGDEGCTFTGRAVSFCGTRSNTRDPDLLPEYNYFGNNQIISDSFANNCPYMRAFGNADCENPLYQEGALLGSREVYGAGSRCLSGTLAVGSDPQTETGFCFPIECSGNSLIVTVGTATVTCTAAGPQSVTGLAGNLICPDPVEYCARANPARCARGCSGKGTCVNNVCQCEDGWEGDDCGLRVFKLTCSQCGLETNTSCYGDKCGCDSPETCYSAIYLPISIISLIASMLVFFA